MNWRPIKSAPTIGRIPIWLKIVGRKEPQEAFSDTWWIGGWSVECTPTHWKPRKDLNKVLSKVSQSFWDGVGGGR